MSPYPIKNEFVLREAVAADRATIIAIVSKMWGEDITARYEWLYLANPHGRALTWLAFEPASGEAVGCTSIFPRKVLVDGIERLGSIGGDCYIDPRARRRGLATALHRLSFTEMRQHGVDFMYGPPNPNNFAALIKAGSRGITTFKRFVRPLKGSSVYRFAFDRAPSKLEARLAGLPIKFLDRVTKVEVEGLRLEAVSEFSAEFDALFAEADTRQGVVLVRDSQYLAWHYRHGAKGKQQPFAIRRDEKLVGLAALELRDDYAALVELFTTGAVKLIDATLQLLLNQALTMECASLEISCTPCGLVASRLSRLGFMGRSERGFQLALSASDPQRNTLLNAASWNFLAADQDMDSFYSLMPG
ncbi:MAG: GNAT family N-acetyltransferase [Acidobacteria bacterium]|nr:GNAT family N-acetyltransferase [Acidobacteriota bacterium]